MRELPPIEEVLTMKAVEHLEHILAAKESGKMTNAEYKAAVNAVFAVCSGVADKDFINIITLAAKEVVDDWSFYRTRVFENGSDGIAFINYKEDPNVINVITGKVATNKQLPVIRGSSQKDVEEIISKVTAVFTKAGYSEGSN